MSSSKRILIVLCLGLLPGPPATAENCGNSDRFDINNDGTVTDLDSGLTWMRCSLGQRWDGDTCRGVPARLSWVEAREHIREFNRDRRHAWRLPRLNELATLADRYCSLPRLDLSLFPNTPAARYWSITLVRASEQRAYTLDFGSAGVQQTPLPQGHHIRLVRGRESGV